VYLILNLAFFVFLGSIIPWRSSNQPDIHISAWRFVIGILLIFLLRGIPAVLLLKLIIPDIKTWRDALFYGHFGPIGVGAIYSAALISSEPERTGVAGYLLAVSPNDPMQTSLWPIMTFVVLCSSIVHGSSGPLLFLRSTLTN
jgi:NhaP-type Na+/H+ or K+/H+ antiporter